MNGHRRNSIVAGAAVIVAIATVAACSQQRGPGQLAVKLVDAPNPNVTAINVNVTAVRTHEAGIGWRTVSDVPVRVDLMKLKDSVQDLGLVNLPAGTITQIRLLVSKDGNTAVVDGVEVPLVVPSGTESGIKIGGPWEIGPCALTTVTLDFDGDKSISVHPTGSGDEWILRPVVRTKKTEHAPGTCNGDEGGTGPGGTGAACTEPQQCLSGECNDGACAPGGPGVPCKAAADCASGTCGPDDLCAPGDAGGAGTPCTADTQCLSNACGQDGLCAPGGQGTTCHVDADCAAAFFCAGTVCAERTNL
ncbi:DUF4382 domain-containing protein [Anaeromyxobacter oryzae]|uniref:DUF4382 domain-containing protein n=1 Tax=Anaeromyxobacter oryzae TaxID=2918170 RepID=A0ABN6MS19_9BACT|nr:DUF4382 domain-containing protein [Anaeromyxobacter oryzae]BDG03774.1 hypothetical protein AMOR_27700 [Anaeromyxobacter oryzae]